MLKKSNLATPRTIKFKAITKVLRAIPNGYSATRDINLEPNINTHMPCFSSRNNRQSYLKPNTFFSSVYKAKKERIDDEIHKANFTDLLLFDNTISPDKSFYLKTESHIDPVTITDENESIHNICFTEQSELGRNICLTEQCDFPNDNNNYQTNNISILDTPTNFNQRDLLNKSDLIYNINILNLETAAMKLTKLIEKKKKRRRSYNKTNIDLATNKLASIIDRKRNVRRTCSGGTQGKLNKYIEIFKEERKLTQIKKLEDIINKDRKSGVPTSTPSPSQSFKELSIKNRYFIHNDNDTSRDYDEGIKQMSYSYMMAFKDWRICKEKHLLNQKVIEHLASFTIKEEVNFYNTTSDIVSSYNNKQSPSKSFIQRGTPTKIGQAKTDISQWGRKDISNEIAKAEIYKDSLNTKMSNDTIKYDLTSLLNVLTVDNYANIQADILSIISDSSINQEKFIEVILRKAITEKAFVKLYATLCKDLDHLLPSSSLSISQSSKSTMRIKLIDSCKGIFNLDLNAHTQDSSEKEHSMKRYIIGNVNFIGELINVKMVTKKVGLYCIESLFNKYNQLNQSKTIRCIHIEALVSFIDKFGTIIYQRIKANTTTTATSKSKTNKENDKEIELLIHNYISQLSQICKDDSSLPGYIKYKIINLEEKEKNKWEETLFEKTIRAKGKRDLQKERRSHEEEEEADDDDDKEQGHRDNDYNSNSINLNKEINLSNQDKEANDNLQSSINIKVKNSLKDWMAFLSEGNKPKIFNWTEIDDLIVNKKTPMKTIFIAYIESTIDAVTSDTSLLQANDYFKVILQYYYPSFQEWEISELKAIALDLLSNIVEMQLDNSYIPKIWGCIIYYFLEYKIFFMKDFNMFLSFDKDAIKGVFIAFKHTIYYTKSKEKRHMNDFKQVRLIKENSKLFEDVI